MYKENKLWSSSFLSPSKVAEPRTSQLVVYFWCPFSFAYVVASYGCCSCCSCNTKVVEEKDVTTTQEHKKLANKRNLIIQNQEKSNAFNIK
jgi:hypothetical protein